MKFKIQQNSVRSCGFTVLELLVVLAIIAALATMTLPALKGISTSNLMSSVNRQMLDAVALARQKAISERTTIYLVFAGPVEDSKPISPGARGGILERQFRAYALYAARSAGDQPGQHHPRYLYDWQDLPKGALIAPWKFAQPPGPATATAEDAAVLTFDYRDFPYPTVDSTESMTLPYIAFGENGGVVSTVPPEGEVIIPMARGSYFLSRDAQGDPTWVAATPREQPPLNSVNNYNHIVIDALTGRARIDRPTIQ